MTPENFVYWLQGYLELTANPYLDTRQVAIIQEHIALVMKKETLLKSDNMNELDVVYIPHMGSC